ncbi:MAG TPA: type II secretion system F family protein [Clostridiales bacterium]|nr:type II secretion system F family protein [Clostridiales bacterium]
MAGYSYIAIDPDGKERKGKMEAPNEERVFYTLKAEGYFPVSIKELGVLNKDFQRNMGSPIKLRELSVFSRQFYRILHAGIPIVRALSMLIEQTENKKLRKAVKETLVLVEKGERLADAMRNQGKIFPPLMINLIEAGEASGNLEVALERISVQFEKEARLRAMVKKAMIYPTMLGIISLGVIILMLVFVIPNFMNMFNDMDLEMPAITLAVMAMSDFVMDKWYLIIGVIAGIGFAMVTFKKTDRGKRFFAKLSLSIPIFGKLNIKTASARFSRTLGTMIASGISLIDAIDITARTIDNIIIKQMLMETKEEIVRGVPLSTPLMVSGIFPPMVYHMIKIGEETGSMEDMLTKIADYYDEEVDIATQTLTSAMDPLIIIVLAIIVGIMVMAIMQPMFSMYDQLSGALGI